MVGTISACDGGRPEGTAPKAAAGDVVTVDVPNGVMGNAVFMALRKESNWDFSYKLYPGFTGEAPRIEAVDDAEIDSQSEAFERDSVEVQLPEELAPGEVRLCFDPEITDDCIAMTITG
jgi:hypothetical protein